MGRSQTSYVCQSCGQVERKWLGRCPGCSEWNTLVEEQITQATGKARGRPAPGGHKGGRAEPITKIKQKKTPRFPLGLDELDRVLGGGLVPGALTLIGGEPGVGKSTLLLTCGHLMAQQDLRTLYVSAEESTGQTRLRAERLGALSEELYLQAETDLSVVLAEVERIKPAALIIDSVQTVYVPELDAAPGSVSQVREVCARLMHLAKRVGVSTFLVGHVTKDGAIAGPRTLEHMVDTVLFFENTRTGSYRIMRAHKNRFGSTNELAVFEMADTGLKEVKNPSAFFLAERPVGRPGSVVAAVLEGTRPLLVEVQGLCVETNLGNPRRTTLGFDSTRCALLAAVLERRCGLSLVGQDLFINVAGGGTLQETAGDLPVALAMASSLRNKPVDPGLVCFGEVGLSGEIRGVHRAEERLHEAKKLGFTQALLPMAGADKLKPPKGMALMPISSLEEALDVAFG
jgi:DNA repair protein RadA/Sms